MRSICDDLLTEYSALAAVVERFTEDRWRRSTQFHGWTSWDQIAHLCFFDEQALLSVTDARQFKEDAVSLEKQMAGGLEVSEITRRRFGHMSGAELLDHWRDWYTKLVRALSGLSEKERLPWYGPSMSARSFAAARLMETWAHGQDIYDSLQRERPSSDRIRHIAHLGVGTFGWSFINRGLPVPKRPPFVELYAASGQVWRWNEPSNTDYVLGSAEEFCLVVTQRRNVMDTCLKSRGENARRWLAIAQCFAGPAAEPPAPGARVWP